MAEWDRNPLLREEVAKARVKQSTLAPLYAWAEGAGLVVVSWRGHQVGTVWENGSYRLTWRGRVHRGKAGSKAQAVRHMARWLAARGAQSPLLPADKASSAPSSLADFVRDYDDSDI